MLFNVNLKIANIRIVFCFDSPMKAESVKDKKLKEKGIPNISK